MSESSISQGAAIVTGAAQGLGRAIAIRLAKDGYQVAVNDLPSRLEALEQLVIELSDHGRAIAVTGDVTDETSVQGIIAKTVTELGDLQLFVANAAIGSHQFILDESVEYFNRVMNVNVGGVFLCYREAAKQMIKQGKGGCIIGAGSVAGKKGQVMSAYSASKFAVRGLTQTAAQEWGRHGIRVNSYAPGPVATDMWNNMEANVSKKMGGEEGTFTQAYLPGVSLGRLGQAEEVADLVSFLTSPGAKYITGQSIIVDGGAFFD